LIGVLAGLCLSFYYFDEHFEDGVTDQEVGGGILFFARVEVSIVRGLHEMPDDCERLVAIHNSREYLFVCILSLLESALLIVSQTLGFTDALEVGRKLEQKHVGDFAHLFC